MTLAAHIGWQVVALVVVFVCAYFARLYMRADRKQFNARLDDVETVAHAAMKTAETATLDAVRARDGVGALASRVEKLELGGAVRRAL